MTSADTLVATRGFAVQVLPLSSTVCRALRGSDPHRRSAGDSVPEGVPFQPLEEEGSTDRQHDVREASVLDLSPRKKSDLHDCVALRRLSLYLSLWWPTNPLHGPHCVRWPHWFPFESRHC